MASVTSPGAPTSIRNTPRPPSRSYNTSGDTSVPAPFDAICRQPRQPLYRPVRPLTYELASHAKAYLEAKSYTGGYTFLESLLSSGTSISTPAKPYRALLAPTAQLALAASLVVYPATTTKARSDEDRSGSDAALRYLRHVCTVISPLNDQLRAAFTFPDERSRRRTAASRGVAHSPSPDNIGDTERLKGLAANVQSLWYRANDFWHVVGWAFNCSVAHKKRWERWKLWLGLMIGLMEKEWEERCRLAKERNADKDKILMESLLWHYISTDDPTNRSNRRRMTKAILAMGTARSIRHFPEIWEDETVEPTLQGERQMGLFKIDIGKDDMGAFMQDDEDVAMRDVYDKPNASRSRPSRKAADEGLSPKLDEDMPIENLEDAVASLGGMDAIQLRQRLVALLTQAAQAFPSRLTKLGDLFDHFTEELVCLPTFMFNVFLSTTTVRSSIRIGLGANLLLPLSSGGLPDYTIIEPTQAHFEDILLPLRATTQSYAANAKISFILEQIFMIMLSNKSLRATENLRKTMQSGIDARKGVYGTARSKKGNTEEENQAKLLMEMSAERLLKLLEILEVAAGKPPPPARYRAPSLALTSSLSSAISVSSHLGSGTEDEE